MLLLIDKPKGITSHDVVSRVRKITGEKRVGHAGTLDPNATGLLIVGVGRESTKKLGFYSQNVKKIYNADVVLGEERDTDDPEGKVTFIDKKLAKIPLSKIKSVLKDFEGDQEQIPPIYSAIRIRGKKAYEIAREGKKVNMPPRQITIHSIKLLKYSFPLLKLKITCSSGTYIRSLARDLGEALGTKSYLKNLRRTAVGAANIKNSIKLENLDENWKDLPDFVDNKI